ncbi:hypothetical protein GCM10011492_43800 [Flexivirga endophytica]|uniref:DUF2079 domain-containing protein n=1 Tax=Flexivirga endophytica TaxID=1849103 RepID=A0A916TJB9_9MICO|nr:DUF2079 domain-containing protein [Flexivirga endophytica]GGB47841.1 hypothetical protein GCM10011492_43800 [Flexivirga endophytica]GHB60791.1 hypothetical protein GCM10008112_32190 [Flexivirga endophytica]
MTQPSPAAEALTRHPAPGTRRPAWLLGAASAVVASVFFAVLALGRWNAGNSADYDLGIFAQGADAWSRGQWPESHIRGLSLLGDHFSPLLATWGVVWRIWPTPPALLITQSVLLGAALGVIVGYARCRAGWKVAVLIAVVGIFSRAVLTTAMFDVHEVAYAAIGLAVLCIALLQHRFGWALAASVWLLLTKEDMGLTVFAAGACWWWMYRGDGWRRPLALAGLGVAGVIVAMLVLAAVEPGSGSGYLAYFGIGKSNKLPVPEDHSLSPQRLLPVLMYVVLALVIGVRSKLTVLAIPTLLWRAVSSNIHYWALDFHYDIILWPIGLLAFVDVVSRYGVPRLHSWQSAGVGVAIVAGFGLAVSEMADRAVAPGSMFRTAAVVTNIRSLADDHLPKGARVATQADVGAYLVPTYDAYSLRPDQHPSVDYVMFTGKPKWLYQVPKCAKDKLIRDAEQVWRRGTVTLVKLPHRQRITPTC